MNVASLELCKTLYELSGWFDPASIVCWSKESYGWDVVHMPGYIPGDEIKPAYDLGYLLRKLSQDTSVTRMRTTTDRYMAKSWPYERRANTPEDALCKLAIELFKQGVLTR